MDLVEIECEICAESIATGQGLIEGFLNKAISLRTLC